MATESETEKGERIAKRLARAGVCSRRDAEKLIAEGRVSVDGKVLTTPATLVTDAVIITVDGAVVGAPERTRLFRYHKPRGKLTTSRDPQGRPTIYEDLPPGLPRVISIGRLDFNSEGLLLLTNDGALARRLELPDIRHARTCSGHPRPSESRSVRDLRHAADVRVKPRHDGVGTRRHSFAGRA